MFPWRGIFCLCFSLSVFHYGFAESSPDEPKQVYTDVDATAVNELRREIHQLSIAGDFSKCHEKCQAVLTIHENRLGGEHWETVSSRRKLEAFAAMQKLSETDQLRIVQALNEQQQALAAEHKSDFPTVLRLVRRSSTTVAQLLPASCWTNLEFRFSLTLATFVTRQTDRVEVARESLDIHKQSLGIYHPATAESYVLLSRNYINQQNDKAMEYLRQAVDIYTRTYGATHPETLRTTGELGSCLILTHQLEEAEKVLVPTFQQVNSLYGEDEQATIYVASKMAQLFMNKRQFHRAEPILLQVHRAYAKRFTSRHAATLERAYHLASVWQLMGKSADAADLYRWLYHMEKQNYSRVTERANACAIRLARCLFSLGEINEATNILRATLERLDEEDPLAYEAIQAGGKYLEQLDDMHLVEFLRSHSELPDELTRDPVTLQKIESRIMLATLLGRQERFDEALATIVEIKQVGSKLIKDSHPLSHAIRRSHAQLLLDAGRLDEAEQEFRACFAKLDQASGMSREHVIGLHNSFGENLYRRGKTQEAMSVFHDALHDYEQLRQEDPGIRGAKNRDRVSPVGYFVNAELQTPGQDAGRAWELIEKDLASGLVFELRRSTLSIDDPDVAGKLATLRRSIHRMTEQLAAQQRKLRNSSEPPREEDVSAHDALLFELANSRLELRELERTIKQQEWSANGFAPSLSVVQNQLSAKQAIVGWFDDVDPIAVADKRTKHWGYVIRNVGPPRWFRIDGSGDNAFWSHQDQLLIDDAKRELSTKPDDVVRSLDRWNGIRKRLHEQWITPLLPHLRDVEHLIVVPSGVLSDIPIQALTSEYRVTYCPSATVFALVSERALQQRPDPRRVLFAVGAAGSKNRLQHTGQEIEDIASTFQKPVVLVDANATEKRIEEFVASDQLRGFSHLHFAVHATPNHVEPLQCRLRLTPDPKRSEIERFDDSISARQVFESWNLNAQLVVLSACDTISGSHSSSEGELGFVQAFFVAGADNVILTRWPIHDHSTRELMTTFYCYLSESPNDPISKALSYAQKTLEMSIGSQSAGTRAPTLVEVAPVKLAGNKRGNDYAHPYYWAGFVHFGCDR